jgi:hypothetical protein
VAIRLKSLFFDGEEMPNLNLIIKKDKQWFEELKEKHNETALF